MKIWIDVDAGVDDAQGLLLLLSSLTSNDIIGVSSVFGNADVDQVTRNILTILSLAAIPDAERIDVFKGASKPLFSPRPDPTEVSRLTSC